LEKIYLDNAATTKIDEEVFDAMLPYLKNYFGNASSIHSYGKTAKVMLEDARDVLAEFTGVSSKEIVFTNSGTESNNHAIKGTAFRHIGTEKNHIISSTVEHSAVLDTLKYLEERFNFDVTYIKPDRFGRIGTEEVLESIRPETFLISIMHSNNETGAITDIKSLTESILEKDINVHSDTVQSLGKTDLNFKDININFATISAHKIYGPKGIAVLYIKDKTIVDKFIHGGKQERDLRGGTENIAAIAGFKKAIEILKRRMTEDVLHYTELKNILTSGLNENFDKGIIYNSDTENCLQNIVNISFGKKFLEYDEEMLLIKLDLKGIAVSGGSACTAGTLKPSYVLKELGHDERTALGSIRISFGRSNTLNEIEKLLEVLKENVKKK